jgi:PAS domain S-box-containing protein
MEQQMATVESNSSINRKVNTAIYRMMSDLMRHSVMSDLAAQFQIIFCFLQEISLPLSTVFPWSPLRLGWLQNALVGLRLDTGPPDIKAGTFESTTAYIVGFSIFAFYCIPFLLLGYTFYRYYNKHPFKKTFPIKLFTLLASLCFGILYIPTIFSVGRFYAYSTNPLELILVTLFLIAVLLFGWVYEGAAIEWWSGGSNVMARAHSRPILLMLVWRTVTALLYGSLEPQANTFRVSYFLCVLFLSHYVSTFVAFWYEIPFYRIKTVRMFAAGYAVCGWAALCLLLTLVVSDSKDTGSAWLFLFGAVIMLPSSTYLVESRIRRIQKMSPYIIQSSAEADIYVRVLHSVLLVQQSSRKFNSNSNDRNNNYAAAAGFHENFRTFADLERLFHLFSMRFPTCPNLHYTWSAYAFTQSENRLLAMAKLRHILSKDMGGLHTLTCESRLRYMVNSRIRGEKDSGVKQLLELQKMQRLCTVSMITCLSQQLKFWKMLTSPDTTVEGMKELASDIDKDRNLARVNLQKLVSANPNNAIYRHLYAQFLVNVVQDEQAAAKHIKKGKEIEAAGIETKEEDLLHATDGMVIISGEYADTGRIIYVNEQCCNLLGYSNNELVDKNIRMCMVKTYAEEHNGNIYRYINTRKSKIVQNKRPVIIKHALGHVFMANLNVFDYTLFNEEPNISFLGILRKISEQKNFVIVNGNDGTLVDVSASFLDLFLVDFTAMRNGDMYMEDLVYNYDECMPDVLKELEENSSCIVCFEDHKGRDPTPLNFEFNYLPNVSEHKKILLVYIERSDEGGEFFTPLPKKDNSHSRRGSNRGSSRGSKVDLFGAFETEIVKEQNTKGIYEQALKNPDIFRFDLADHPVTDPNNKTNDYENAKNISFIRLALERKRNVIDPTLTKTFNTMLLTLFFTAMFAVVAQITWERVIFERFQTTIELITKQTQLQTIPITCEYDAMIFTQILNGIPGLDKEKELTRIGEDMRNVVSLVDKLEEFLQSNHYTLSDELEVLYSTYAPMVMFDSTTRKVNLVEGLHLYAYAASLVNVTQLDADDGSMLFFRMNQNSPLSMAFFTASASFHDDQKNTNHLAESLSVALVIAAITIVVFLAIGVFLPAIRTLERQKDAVFHLFSSINRNLIRDTVLVLSDRLNDMLEREEDLANYKAYLEDIQSDANWFHWSASMKDSNKKSKEKVITLWHVVTQRSSLKILAALLLVIIHFTTLHFWWASQRVLLYEDIDWRVELAGYRSLLVRKIGLEIMRAVDDYIHSPYGILVNSSMLQTLEEELWRVEHAIIYGDESFKISNTISVLPDSERVLFFDSLCDYLPSINKTSCDQTSKGLLRRGSHQSLLQLTQVINNLRFKYISLASNPVKPQPNLTDAENFLQTEVFHFSLEIRELIDKYLIETTTIGAETLVKEFKEKLSLVSTGRKFLTVAFVLANVCLVVFIFRPMMFRLDIELKHVRALLVVIPQTILENSFTLRKTLNEIVVQLMN